MLIEFILFKIVYAILLFIFCLNKNLSCTTFENDTSIYLRKKIGWSFELRCVFWINLYVIMYIKTILFLTIRFSLNKYESVTILFKSENKIDLYFFLPKPSIDVTQIDHGYVIYFKSCLTFAKRLQIFSHWKVGA